MWCNVVQRCQRRTEPRPRGICTQNFVKIGPAIFVIHSWRDRHTDRQTDGNTPLPYWGGVIIIITMEWRWRDCAIGKATDLRFAGRRFRVLAGHHCVMAFAKLLTPVCLCHITRCDMWTAKDARRIEDLADQLYSTLQQGSYLGRSCPWRPVILKAVFKLLDQESPRLLLKLARLILAVSHSSCLAMCFLFTGEFYMATKLIEGQGGNIIASVCPWTSFY